jgi:Fic family protein
MRQTGKYVTITTLGEAAKAFVPSPLPPANPALDLASCADTLAAAELALSRLNAVVGLVQSLQWLAYTALRKEALLTSQIEGTQATLVDVFDAEAAFPIANADDVEEVTNYLRAFTYSVDQLRSARGLPLSLRLLCEAHRRLMTGARGGDKQPGEIRRSQNWIGGSRPSNAIFVPPPQSKLAGLLSDLEIFIHADSKLHPLIRVAIAHAQFETIHPFLDGNGRIGRLLIALMLEEYQLVSAPVLYVSSYLKRHQNEYYDRLGGIRTQGDWEGWVSFFLSSVAGAAAESERTIIDIQTLINTDRARLLAKKNVSQATYRLFELLPEMPRFSVDGARKALETTFPTANAAVANLVEAGIVTELTGRRKNRGFSYEAYVQRLSK